MKMQFLRILLISILVFLGNTIYAQNYEVKGAGTNDINGIYVPDGKKNGITQYRKGDYILFYKGCHSKWMIKSPKGNFYRNKTDSKTPPEKGWEKGCGEGSMNPAPVIIPVSEKLDK